MDAGWVGRAGILAEVVSFIFIAPEILGPQRLKGAEEALRNGMASLAVRRAVIAAWGVLYMVAFVAGTLPLVILHPNIGWQGFVLLNGAVLLSNFSMFVCRTVVDHRLAEQETKGAVLFVRQGELGRASIAVLNPIVFGRIMKPSRREWVFWAVGIPFHLLSFVGYVILPAGLLTLIHLEQRLLAAENRLRALVFGTGVILLFGGLATQFYATF